MALPASLTQLADPDVRWAITQLFEESESDPDFRIEDAALDLIVSAIADDELDDIHGIAALLQGGQDLSPQFKLALAQRGLSAEEGRDVRALLAEPEFEAIGSEGTINFLRALAGIENLRPDLFDQVGPLDRITAIPSTPERIAG